MRTLRKYAGYHRDVGRAIRMISDDEDNHLAYCHQGLRRLAWAGHADTIRRALRATALAEIGIYRDVSNAVMAHLGRILRWPRWKSAILAAGIQAVYVYEKFRGLAADGIPQGTGPAQRTWPAVTGRTSYVIARRPDNDPETIKAQAQNSCPDLGLHTGSG